MAQLFTVIFRRWQRALLNVQRHWLFSVIWSRWQQDPYLPPTTRIRKDLFELHAMLSLFGWRVVERHLPSVYMWMSTAFIYPSVIDPVKPDPMDFFPSPNENLASPMPGEIFNFTRPVCGFPDAIPAHIISKTQNSVLTERGNLVGNLPSQWRFLSRKPSATASVTEGCIHWFGVTWIVVTDKFPLWMRM